MRNNKRVNEVADILGIHPSIVENVDVIWNLNADDTGLFTLTNMDSVSELTEALNEQIVGAPFTVRDIVNGHTFDLKLKAHHDDDHVVVIIKIKCKKCHWSTKNDIQVDFNEGLSFKELSKTIHSDDMLNSAVRKFYSMNNNKQKKCKGTK